MKKNIQKIGLALFGALISASAWSQCPTVTCLPDTIIYSDPTTCGAIFTYSDPQGIDLCDLVADTFNFTGTIDSWVVPAGITQITIEARGAAGSTSSSSAVSGGMGAIMIGDFAVTPGQSLSILVGQNYTAADGNGGGGGTFVVDAMNNPLIVAGGGGGSGAANDSADKHGQAGTAGGTGSGGGGTGGTAGNGGNIGATFASGAGAGLLTNGADGWSAGSGGQAFVNGGAGANIGYGIGGFGGGGNGSGNVVGGGGGGYSGGGSASNSVGGGGVGGGGGSFNAGTNQSNTAGANAGNGMVIISFGGQTTTALESGIGSGNMFPVGTTTENFSVVNALGDSAYCFFNVTVVDTISPTLVVPADVASCDTSVNGLAASYSDNCAGESLTFSMTGATTASGSGNITGSTFNIGTTTVTYTVTDASGNQTSSSFEVVINPLPSVSLDAFTTDTLCVYFSPVALPAGSPVSGTYSGSGISGSDFDPALAGNGTHWITYTYTDSLGCSNADSSIIIVDGCLGLDETESPIGLSIYPNPGTGVYTIQFENASASNFEIQVTDVHGRTVYSAEANDEFVNQTIDIQKESQGIYLLEIRSESVVGVYRIIKE